MAVVGDAYIIVHAVTAGVKADVKKSFRGLDSVGKDAGSSVGNSFTKSFNKGAKFDFKNFEKKAEAAKEKFNTLVRTGYSLGAAVGVILPAIAALGGAVVILGANLVAAAPAAMALGGALVAVGLMAVSARIALGGVGAAVAKLNKGGGGAKDATAAKRRVADARQALLDTIKRNKEALREADLSLAKATQAQTRAQLDLNKALEEGNEELQQLGFEAEDAAIAEQKAAIELEKARDTLARVQDLPPNSRARKEAELAFAQADLNYRKAKDKNADIAKEQDRLAETGVEGLSSVIDAREKLADAGDAVVEAEIEKANAVADAADAQKKAELDVARAIADLKKGASGGADPLEGLTKSQKTFALFLADLKPKIDEFKEEVAANFLPSLQDAIDLLVNGPAFDVFKTGMGKVAKATGGAALELAQAIDDAGNLADLDKVFDGSSKAIEKIGGIIGNLWGIVLSVLIAVDPILQDFLTWIENWTGKWEAAFDTAEGQQNLTDFFTEAGEVAAQIGEIVGNVIGAIGGIAKANTGPGSGGQLILDYLKDVTAEFEAWSGSQEAKDLFKGLATNAIAILDAVGPFVKKIIDLGADPNVKIFFDKLGEGAPMFSNIMDELVKAAPALADFLLAFLKLTDILTDGDTIIAFFDTLTIAIGYLNSFLELPAVKGFLDWIAPLLGRLQAFGVILGVIKTAFFVLAGTFLLNYVQMLIIKIALKLFIGMLKSFAISVAKFGIMLLKFASGALKAVITGFKVLKVVMMANPILLIVTLIAALIAYFIYLYNTSDEFKARVDAAFQAVRDVIKGVIDAVVGFFTGAWDWVKENWPKLLDILTYPYRKLWEFLQDTWTTIIEFIKGLGARIKTAATNIWDSITTFISDQYTNVKNKFKDIVDYVKGVPGKITSALSGMFDGIKTALTGAWQAAKDWWNEKVKGKGFTIGGIKIGDFTTPKFEFKIPGLAAGGIVPATPGGMLARIGEAGKAERVEPLDRDGMSKRDKAMIDYLSGGKAGGVTVNVYPSAGMDEKALADMVSRKISFMMRKGAVA
jgi:hypothetical protein